MKIPNGFSRSNDKVRENLMQSAAPDVKQFLLKNNPLRYINPDKLKLQLKGEEESKSSVI